jgi:hypothetical protein
LLRYLTIADLTVIPPEVVGHIVIAHETKLAIAVLWRLAKLPKFVPAILANAKSLTAYDPWDAFLLFVVMARHSDAREAVRDCSVLPRILTAVVSAADLQGLSGVASFLHRLPINVTALRKLERSGFIKAFLRRGSSLGDREAYAACHLLADALLRVGLAPSFLEFIPVFAKNLREEPTLERSAVQALVLFSGYRRGRDKLTEHEIVQSVTATELQEGASRALFDKLVENMTRE